MVALLSCACGTWANLHPEFVTCHVVIGTLQTAFLQHLNSIREITTEWTFRRFIPDNIPVEVAENDNIPIQKLGVGSEGGIDLPRPIAETD